MLFTSDPACKDAPDLWFSTLKKDVEYAKNVCLFHCPLFSACFKYTMELEKKASGSFRWGIFAGMDSVERQAMLKRMKRGATNVSAGRVGND